MTIDFDAKGKRRKRYTDRAESFETERTVWLSAPLTSTSWRAHRWSLYAQVPKRCWIRKLHGNAWRPWVCLFSAWERTECLPFTPARRTCP